MLGPIAECSARLGQVTSSTDAGFGVETFGARPRVSLSASRAKACDRHHRAKHENATHEPSVPRAVRRMGWLGHRLCPLVVRRAYMSAGGGGGVKSVGANAVKRAGSAASPMSCRSGGLRWSRIRTAYSMTTC